jgi:hypothetical protein
VELVAAKDDHAVGIRLDDLEVIPGPFLAVGLDGFVQPQLATGESARLAVNVVDARQLPRAVRPDIRVHLVELLAARRRELRLHHANGDDRYAQGLGQQRVPHQEPILQQRACADSPKVGITGSAVPGLISIHRSARSAPRRRRQ